MAESAAHASHDPLLVAAAVDRGARLAPVLDLCSRCVGLYGDLVALTAALPLGALPARTRDFALDADDVRRLRPGGWRGWWSTVGSARDTLTRPLAVGLTTLGVAGLVLTAAPMPFLGSGTAAAPSAAAVPGTMAIGADRLATSPLPPGPTPEMLAGGTTRGAGAAPMVEEAPAISPTLLLSLGLLGAGSTLFAVRRVAVHGRPVR